MKPALSLAVLLFAASSGLPAAEVEQWGVFQWSARGPVDGNPFADVTLTASFQLGSTTLKVSGFYDGDGQYVLRFSPPTRGEWTFVTSSNRAELNGKTGTFTAKAPSAGNRGPVSVKNMFHFAYADGTPYRPIGTTCYGWVHLGDTIERQTIASLKSAPFNKVRMCILPKWYAYNRLEPPRYPFAGTPPKNWDWTRFNPAFFRHIEERILELQALGIEADLILFHPYDEGHWGFDRMPAAADDRYIRYCVARFAAYRNVWWSLANEFDFMKEKSDADWDRILQVTATADPYRRLLSIHNGTRLYNLTHPLITHASIQNGSAVADFGRAVLFRDVYRKPIVFDEVKYEGDLEQRWGNLSAEEMVHRFWQGIIAGTYVTHGETYRDSKDMIWWSKGGELHGQSPKRIAFLKSILESAPADGLEPIDKWQDERTAGKKGEYYLVYFGKDKPTTWDVELPRSGLDEVITLQADLIETWNMTIDRLPGTFKMKADGRYRIKADPPARIPMPGKPYQAIRLKAVKP